MNKEYLGDSVYVAYDGFALILTTENGSYATNSIVLESEVYLELVRYVKKLRKREEAGSPGSSRWSE